MLYESVKPVSISAVGNPVKSPFPKLKYPLPAIGRKYSMLRMIPVAPNLNE